jgi:hypothetical protein
MDAPAGKVDALALPACLLLTMKCPLFAAGYA